MVQLAMALTIWFIDNTNDIAIAYNASTRVADASKDIYLPAGSSALDGAATTGGILWVLNDSANTLLAFSLGSTSQLVAGGQSYTTDGDTDGFVSQTLSGIADNQSFAITVSGSGFVEIYPQI